MNFVEPIRDRKKIAQIKNLLRGQERYRDLLLFVVGITEAKKLGVIVIIFSYSNFLIWTALFGRSHTEAGPLYDL